MKNSFKNVIILHGWGLSGKKYDKLCEFLNSDGYKTYAPDLPGFGNEKLRKKSMTLDDYVDFVKDFIEEKKIQKPFIFIGHSFGGRIALKYSWKYPKDVSKLCLTGVPVIRDRSVIKKLFFVLATTGGKIMKILPKNINNFFRKGLYFVIGEWDYYNAGPLKQVFKNIIEEDLVEYMREVRVPTFLIWGKNDILTPASMVSKIKKINPSVRSKIVPNMTHKFPYESSERFARELFSIF